MTYGSSHRMCESNVHTYSNPYASARLARSITRARRRRRLQHHPELHVTVFSREAEVDGAAWPGSGQRLRDDLGAGVEVDAFGAVHVRVAEQAGLPAAEAVVADRHRDRHVDADHADLHVELELAGGAAVAGEDRRAVAVRVVVDQLAGPRRSRRSRVTVEHRPEDLVVVAAPCPA